MPRAEIDDGSINFREMFFPIVKSVIDTKDVTTNINQRQNYKVARIVYFLSRVFRPYLGVLMARSTLY